MRAFNEQAQSDEIGRDIGFDMYRFGIPIIEMESYSSVREGFKTAQIQNTTKIARSTIFARKLMQIRMRAYLKGIAVEITEADLEAAFNECKGVCPVTGRAMTKAQIADTDWSVDRLDNDSGYVPGNIVVMSSMANKAKGDISLKDLIMYCIGGEVSVTARTRLAMQDKRFWQRMLNAYYKKMPSHVFGKVTQEFCADPVSRFAIILALNLHLFSVVSQNSRHETERLFSSCPFLGGYLKDGTISKADIAKMRKSALNAMRSTGMDLIDDDLNSMFQLANAFVQAKRSMDIVNRLVERWNSEIDSDETRRTVMLAVLIKE